MRITHVRTAAGVVTVAALALTGCSAASQTQDAEAPASPAAAAPRDTPESGADPARLSANSIVPNVEVLDVVTGETVSLPAAVKSDKPVLLWAWAPHCPTCRAEAPGLEQFAAAHSDKFTVVGIGTQDDEQYARDFIADTGVSTPRMLWDASYESWRAMGITVQPTWILIKGNGEPIDGWVGGLPESEILARV